MSATETLWDCYNQLLISDDIDRVKKLLVRYELFKTAMAVPGDIVECGVFKGAGVFYWAKLLKIYNTYEKRKVVGFDTFRHFSKNLLEYEQVTAEKYVQEADFQGVPAAELKKLAVDSGFDNIELVEGEIEDTAEDYKKKNPGFRIALLHLDFDSYGGTKTALECFYELVAPGGMILLDEYAKRGWGESDAVDDFFRGRKFQLHSVPYSSQPSAYLIKEF